MRAPGRCLRRRDERLAPERVDHHGRAVAARGLLERAGEVRLVEPDDRVSAGLPRFLEPLGTAAGRDDSLGSLKACCLHRRETDGAGSPEDENSIPGADLRAPYNGKPARHAGRPASRCELVRHAVGNLERLLFHDRRELRQCPVASAAAEPVVRDVHAGARVEQSASTIVPTPSEPGTYGVFGGPR